jgi:hypothetical protein
MAVVWMLSLGAALAGCRASSSESETAALGRAENAARRLPVTLRTKLVAAVASSGHAKAIDVCAVEAPALAAQIHTDTGATVGRASLRLRAPADAPPPWVAEWLAKHGERSSAGVEGMRGITSVGGGRVARVLLPLTVEGPCLSCHGGPADLAPGVRAALDARYPGDRATGYRIGDLRGASWAEVPVGR